MSQNTILDPSVLGTDVSTNDLGDLDVLVGDYAVVSGIPNAINAFVRELTTPYGYLSRFILDCEGLKILDEAYGNVGYFLLSEALTIGWVNDNLQSIEEVAANQPRITLTQATDYVMISPTSVRFNIYFQVLGYPQIFNLVLSGNAAGFTAIVKGG